MIRAAEQVRDKMARIAAHILQGDPATTTVRDGMFHVGDAVGLRETAFVPVQHPYLLGPQFVDEERGVGRHQQLRALGEERHQAVQARGILQHIILQIGQPPSTALM